MFTQFRLREGVHGPHPHAKFHFCSFKNVLRPPKSPKMVIFGKYLPMRKNSGGRVSSVEFSFPLCIEPASGNELRRPPSQLLDSQKPATAVRRHGRRQSSQLVAGFCPTTDIALISRFTRVCPDCEEPATTADVVAES